MGHKNFAMDKTLLDKNDKSFDSTIKESPDERWEDEGGSLIKESFKDETDEKDIEITHS